MLVSRPGVPGVPRKYLLATTLTARCDQPFGASTPSCSKTMLPPGPLITARRVSHSTSSNGSLPGRLSWRSKASPGGRSAVAGRSVGSVVVSMGVLPGVVDAGVRLVGVLRLLPSYP